MQKLSILFVASFLSYGSGTQPKDCFEISGLYGADEIGIPYDDSSSLSKLTQNHELTKVVGCSTSRGQISSI